MENVRVLPRVCANSRCLKLILPPFPEDKLCKECRIKINRLKKEVRE